MYETESFAPLHGLTIISAAGPTFTVEEEAGKQNEKDKKAWKKTCEKKNASDLSFELRAKPSYALVRTPVKENGLESTFFHKEEFCPRTPHRFEVLATTTLCSQLSSGFLSGLGRKASPSKHNHTTFPD